MTDSGTSVGIVVLTWNGWEDTRRCLESLKAVTYPHLQVLVVDNGSHDGTPANVKKEFPVFELHRHDFNLGYAAGNNCGIRLLLESSVALIGILNNDTTVEPGFLEPLVAAFEADPELAVASPQIDYLDPEIRAGRPWYVGGVVDTRSGLPGHEDRDSGTPGDILMTPYLTGCCFLARRDTFELVGNFDERYFLMFEDSDWSARVTKAGKRIAVVPASRIRHAVSASFSRSQSAVGAYYFTRNALLFLSQYSDQRRQHMQRFAVGIPRLVGVDLLRNRTPRVAFARLAGVIAFLTCRWGRAPGIVLCISGLDSKTEPQRRDELGTPRCAADVPNFRYTYER